MKEKNKSGIALLVFMISLMMGVVFGLFYEPKADPQNESPLRRRFDELIERLREVLYQ